MRGGPVAAILSVSTLGAAAEAQDSAPEFIAPGGLLTEFPLAQSTTPLLTLDQERLYTASAFGRRVATELAEASEMLSRENRAIEDMLTSEEQALTDQRPSLDPAEFRALADAFDDKVVGLRRAQDAKARALQRRDEVERQIFLRAAVPVLGELVAELGAVAILDNRAVLFSSERIDVTERAIARIDGAIGAGARLSPQDPILPPAPDASVEEPVSDGAEPEDSAE